MIEDRGFQFHKRLEAHTWSVEGRIYTDASGDVTNVGDGSVVDQYSEAIPYPPGVESVTQLQTGVYRFTLRTPWWKLRTAKLTPYQPGAQSEYLGNVDLRGITLSDLDTKTLKLTTSGSGGEQTVTLSTPSDIDDIATQINAVVTDSAEIVTTDSGVKLLRLVDIVLGSASSLAVNSSSSADVILLGVNGVSTISGKDVGDFGVLRENPRGAGLTLGTKAYLPARTIDVAYVDDAGAALAMVSGAILFEFVFVDQDTQGVRL